MRASLTLPPSLGGQNKAQQPYPGLRSPFTSVRSVPQLSFTASPHSSMTG